MYCSLDIKSSLFNQIITYSQQVPENTFVSTLYDIYIYYIYMLNKKEFLLMIIMTSP